jgi:hypothetical protein
MGLHFNTLEERIQITQITSSFLRPSTQPTRSAARRRRRLKLASVPLKFVVKSARRKSIT